MKQIDNKEVITKDAYQLAVATWKWFITSGGAKPIGYIIPEYKEVNYRYTFVRFQKHKKSAITAEHMVIYNLIRARDPWRGFQGGADSGSYQSASSMIVYKCRNAETDSSRQTSVAKLAAPFGISPQLLIKIVNAAK